MNNLLTLQPETDTHESGGTPGINQSRNARTFMAINSILDMLNNYTTMRKNQTLGERLFAPQDIDHFMYNFWNDI